MVGTVVVTVFLIWFIGRFIKEYNATDKYGRKKRSSKRVTTPIGSSGYSLKRTSSVFQYTSHPNSGRYYVYLLHNASLDATKIGVGSFARVEQHLSSRTSSGPEGRNVGWNLLRLGQFESRSDFGDIEKANAYAAEARVLRYWRKGLGLAPFLERKQMGYSRMIVKGREGWVSTRGWSETVLGSAICEVTTWRLVEKSVGFQLEAEQNRYLRDLIRRESAALTGIELDRYLNSNSFVVGEGDHPSANRMRPLINGETNEQRFWSHVDRREEDECWGWFGSKAESGYSTYVWDGKLVLSHRLIRHLMGFDDYQGTLVLNQCGSRDCINPTHWEPLQRGVYKCITPGCENTCSTTTKSSLCEKCKSRRRRGQLS